MKKDKWQLQDAKNKFSELVRKATSEGPQTVTKHGRDSVVVLSADEYKKMEKPGNSLIDFIRKSPLASVELNIERDKSLSRDITL